LIFPRADRAPPITADVNIPQAKKKRNCKFLEGSIYTIVTRLMEDGEVTAGDLKKDRKAHPLGRIPRTRARRRPLAGLSEVRLAKSTKKK
jgi:hypothetical protein